LAKLTVSAGRVDECPLHTVLLDEAHLERTTVGAQAGYWDHLPR
jgi:hypothetical protein